MRALFIIPCVIMIGGENEDTNLERFFQLQHTIDSILSRFNEPEIRVYEISGNPVHTHYIKELSINCKVFTSENDDYVSDIKNSVKDIKFPTSEKARPFYEKGYIKNATESTLICKALSDINPNDFDRIFKITGRYFFNNEFVLDHHDIEGKITLSYKSKCPLGEKFTLTDYVIRCMYWSFCPTILEDVKDNFNRIKI